MQVCRWFVFVLPIFILTGCVEVNTYVGSRGYITQDLIITVPQRWADGTKLSAQKSLGRDWKVWVEGQGEYRLVYARRVFFSIPEGKPMQGISIQFRRNNRWFRATYEVKVNYDPKELPPEELKAISDRKVTVRFFMPGGIIHEESSVQVKENNLAELTVDPTKPMQLHITCIGILWGRILVLLVIIAILVWLLMPYFPHLIERFQRRTVRIIQP